MKQLYGRAPYSDGAWRVSYAQEDNTEANGKSVYQLCDAARAKGRVIQRDDEQLGLGERISDFMNRMADGKRVFVFLSKAYLQSPYCMYEMLEIWSRCEGDSDKLKSKIILYVVDDVRFKLPTEMESHCAFWREQREAMDRMVQSKKKETPHSRGMLRQIAMINGFAEHTDDILAALWDRLC